MTARRALPVWVCAALVLAQPPAALGYSKFGVTVNGRRVDLTWSRMPVRYFVSDREVPGVGVSDLQAAVARAFETWQGVSTASVTYQFVGTTGALPLEDDGQSTIGFLDRPDLDRVLATTSLLVDTTTGELLEADIFFNTAFRWSVAEAGEAGRYDVQSIALHETGHFAGLSHSALGETEMVAGAGRRVDAAEAVMFPIAYAAGSVAGRTLRADDIAGISDLYPDNGFRSVTGSVSGIVTEGGLGVLGAHGVAFSLTTGALIGGLSLDDRGTFAIAGLAPGPHVIRVEPLDDVDVDSFFDADQSVNLDFRVTYLDRLVVVPKGGASGEIEVRVTPK